MFSTKRRCMVIVNEEDAKKVKLWGGLFWLEVCMLGERQGKGLEREEERAPWVGKRWTCSGLAPSHGCSIFPCKCFSNFEQRRYWALSINHFLISLILDSIDFWIEQPFYQNVRQISIKYQYIWKKMLSTWFYMLFDENHSKSVLFSVKWWWFTLLC